ncbi:hypothetical protein PIB30_045569, partial [Stylosanthes scabra]|nr:hypothetical protein [Stylosanthes scabra]
VVDQGVKDQHHRGSGYKITSSDNDAFSLAHNFSPSLVLRSSLSSHLVRVSPWWIRFCETVGNELTMMTMMMARMK